MSKADSTLGERIRSYRKAFALTQEALGGQIGASAGQISRWEKGRERPNPDNLKALATFFKIEILDLTVGPEARTERTMRAGEYLVRDAHDNENPKPVTIGDIRIENVFLMVGGHTEPLDFSVRYDPEPLKIHPKIRSVYDTLLDIKKANARKNGYPFFNGPNTRLVRVTEENAKQLPTGKEQKGYVLEFGPVSWEEYTVLNDFLDYDAFPGEKTNTIRKQFARNELIYTQSPDLRNVPLSNIFTLVVTPITKDGFGVIQQRSRHGVSSDFGLLVPGVNENIHRFLDEAPADNLAYRLNTVDASRSRGVDANYRPRGVPSPLLSAQRGVYEELSKELYNHTKDSPHRYKFLNIIFDFTSFQPVLIGVIDLDLTSHEVKRMVQEYPGQDHTEHVGIDFLRLDANDPRTSPLIRDQRRWWSASLSGFVSAIHYWRNRGGE